jgi:hypothetical protein
MSDIEKINTEDSSNIASYAYSPKRSVLIVEYKNKAGDITATWEYAKVPPSIFESAKKAESIGGFIRGRVIGYFEGKKISG